MINKLTDAKVKALTKPGMYGDGAGLWLRVQAGGSKSWVFVYIRNKIRRELGLGGLAGIAPVSLAAARRKATEMRQALADGVDPYAEKVARKSTAATFGEVANRYLKEAGDWSSKTEKEWRLHLLEHAAKLGKVAIDAVNTELVEDVLRPIWEKRPATGQRVRGKIEAVLDYAAAKRLRTGQNPARWSGHLEHVLAAASRVTGANHAALPYREVPDFVAELGSATDAQCLKFIVLTAVRTSEAREAVWPEFDLDAATWTIPGVRTKTKKELVVPLAPEVVQMLQARDGKTSFVFEGARKGRPLGNAAMRIALEASRPQATVHGFRSAFSDWAGEETRYPPEIIEWSLGHLVGNAVARAYRRGDALSKRRDLMRDWASYCTSTAAQKRPKHNM